MSIPRVNSNASELNDFDISPEGKKEYHVSPIIARFDEKLGMNFMTYL